MFENVHNNDCPNIQKLCIQEINMRDYIMQLYFHDKYVYNKTNLYLFIFNACRVYERWKSLAPRRRNSLMSLITQSNQSVLNEQN